MSTEEEERRPEQNNWKKRKKKGGRNSIRNLCQNNRGAFNSIQFNSSMSVEITVLLKIAGAQSRLMNGMAWHEYR